MKIWRLRFSLRTLIVLALLAGSGTGLWRQWPAWQVVGRWPEFNGLYLACSADGKWIAAASNYIDENEQIGIFDVTQTSPRCAYRLTTKQGDRIALSPDGKYLMLADGKTLECWDIREQKQTVRFSVDDTVYDLSFSGRDVLIRTPHAVWLWGIPDGKLRRRVGNCGTAVTWGIVELHKIAETRKKLAPLRDSLERIADLDDYSAQTYAALKDAYWTDTLLFVSASPDGKTLMTYLSESPSIQLWDLQSGRKMADVKYESAEPNGIPGFRPAGLVLVRHITERFQTADGAALEA